MIARLQNFQSGEIEVTDPVTGSSHFEANAVTIRKLPEAQLNGRDRQLFVDATHEARKEREQAA